MIGMAVASAAWAQASAPLEEALGQLAMSNGTALLMEGTEEGSRTVELRTNLYFVRNESGSFLELWNYRAGQLSQRLVADGRQLWHHDLALSQVEVASYGEPRGRLEVLLQRLPLMVQSSAAQPVKLLQGALLLRPGSPFRPWYSVGRPEEKLKELNCTVTMRQGGEWTAFELTKKTAIHPYELVRVTGGQDAGARRLNWSMDVRTGFIPAEIKFTFTPPRGVKVVASPQSTGIR